jgi:hypothetical protein
MRPFTQHFCSNYTSQFTLGRKMRTVQDALDYIQRHAKSVQQ